MTILALFVALVISHYAKGLERFRSTQFLVNVLERIEAKWPAYKWLDMVFILVVGLLGGGLLAGIAEGLGGELVWAVVAILVLLWALGPRDLEQDIDNALAGDDGERGSEVLGISANADAHQAGISIYLAALSRWFGVVFWFVVLGIPGALIYRLTERLCDEASAEHDRDGVFRLRFFLEWPVLALMMISSALTNDFDRVYQAWHRYRQSSGEGDAESKWLIHRSLLGELADAVLPEGLDQRGGIQLAHHFVWRMFILWLVVLSVLLLAGWLA